MANRKRKDVTDTFEEEKRHYQKVQYIEKCERYGDDVKFIESNISTSDKKVGRIYLSFGITYGDIYVYP